MDPVTYRVRPESNLLAVVLVPLMLTPGIYSAYKLYKFDWEAFGILMSEDRGLLIIVLGFFSVLLSIFVAVLVHVFRLPWKFGPEFNFLQIDLSGLNYMRHGKSRFWAWNELSGFRLVSRFSRIEFFLPDADRKAAKRDRWVHGVTPRGPYVVIEDVYDASLDEIVATLNAYCHRAIE